jgi:hypothetical protein
LLREHHDCTRKCRCGLANVGLVAARGDPDYNVQQIQRADESDGAAVK